jgi:hypothetical protein
MNCRKSNCTCSSCNPCGGSSSVSGGYTSGILTITVGSSTAVIPLNQESVETRTPVLNTFYLATGNSVTLTETPLISLPFDVYRNGILQDNDRYAVIAKTVTFVSSFGNSEGATGNEVIKIKYYK